MNIGIPLEVMTGEGRIALIPAACKTLIENGHTVTIETRAGANSGYSDKEFQQAGAQVVENGQQLYAASQLIVKVKQPLAKDLGCLRENHILFSYLHLAADMALVQNLCDIGLCAIPFESVSDGNGGLPLLSPMSQVAGRIAAMRGASLLFRNRGGRGVLLGGVDGAETGRVVVLGAGVAGSHAVALLVGLGAHVDVLDLDESKLQRLKQQFPSIDTHLSTTDIVETLCVQADLVIGAVLLAGRRAPVVLKQSVIKQMNEGSVIVDIAIDQGGCVEGIRETSSVKLSYVENGVIHTAVPNMPATVSRTASQSLSSAILPYVQTLADFGIDFSDVSITEQQRANQQQSNQQQVIRRAIAIRQGNIVDQVLAREVENNALDSVL